MLPASAELPMELRDPRPLGHGNGHGNEHGHGPGGRTDGVEVPTVAAAVASAAYVSGSGTGDRSVITIASTHLEAVSSLATIGGGSPQEAIRELREKAIAARQMGFTGDPCPSCQAMQLVRNGTCLKCMSCGATTGCS